MTPVLGLHGAAEGRHQGNKDMEDPRQCRSLGTVVYQTAEGLPPTKVDDVSSTFLLRTILRSVTTLHILGAFHGVSISWKLIT